MHKYTTDELVAQKLPEQEFKKIKRNPIVFVLKNIRSLQNVGLFFRLADALLVEKIYLTGYTGYPPIENDPRDIRVLTHAEKEINKTAIKLVPFVPWEKHDSGVELLATLKTSGYQLVAVEQADQSLDYRKANYKKPITLVFGHERTGVEEDLLEICDFTIHIPMLGMGNSHNVATSATIIASHIILENDINN